MLMRHRYVVMYVVLSAMQSKERGGPRHQRFIDESIFARHAPCVRYLVRTVMSSHVLLSSDALRAIDLLELRALWKGTRNGVLLLHGHLHVNCAF